jgi:hypothetical protein
MTDYCLPRRRCRGGILNSADDQPGHETPYYRRLRSDRRFEAPLLIVLVRQLVVVGFLEDAPAALGGVAQVPDNRNENHLSLAFTLRGAGTDDDAHLRV